MTFFDMTGIERLVVFAIMTTAFTIMMTRASLFEKPKMWVIMKLPKPLENPVGSLLYCSQCLGFWVGFLSSFVLPVTFLGIPVLDNWLAGLVTSLFSIVLDPGMPAATKEDTDG